MYMYMYMCMCVHIHVHVHVYMMKRLGYISRKLSGPRVKSEEGTDFDKQIHPLWYLNRFSQSIQYI